MTQKKLVAVRTAPEKVGKILVNIHMRNTFSCVSTFSIVCFYTEIVQSFYILFISMQMLLLGFHSVKLQFLFVSTFNKHNHLQVM